MSANDEPWAAIFAAICVLAVLPLAIFGCACLIVRAVFF